MQSASSPSNFAPSSFRQTILQIFTIFNTKKHRSTSKSLDLCLEFPLLLPFPLPSWVAHFYLSGSYGPYKPLEWMVCRFLVQKSVSHHWISLVLLCHFGPILQVSSGWQRNGFLEGRLKLLTWFILYWAYACHKSTEKESLNFFYKGYCLFKNIYLENAAFVTLHPQNVSKRTQKHLFPKALQLSKDRTLSPFNKRRNNDFAGEIKRLWKLLIAIN